MNDENLDEIWTEYFSQLSVNEPKIENNNCKKCNNESNKFIMNKEF